MVVVAGAAKRRENYVVDSWRLFVVPRRVLQIVSNTLLNASRTRFCLFQQPVVDDTALIEQMVVVGAVIGIVLIPTVPNHKHNNDEE